MQTSVRYYITRADDQPIVRTIPVACRQAEIQEAVEATAEVSVPRQPERHRRMPKIVRPALRRSVRIGSDKL